MDEVVEFSERKSVVGIPATETPTPEPLHDLTALADYAPRWPGGIDDLEWD